MSATPLLDQEQYTVNRASMSEFYIHQDIEAEFQNYRLIRSLRWNNDTRALESDQMKLIRDGDRYLSVDIDGRGSFMEPVLAYTISFSGSGALNTDIAQIKIDNLRIALAMAKELEAQLKAGKITPPDIFPDTDTWTDLITGKTHKKSTSK